jgi:shikimate kinase
MTNRTGPRPSTLPAPSSSAPRIVVLIGFMGSGKTSVGACLARLLGRPFHDLDLLVEARESRSVGEIFRESGESHFRRAETETLTQLLATLASAPAVIALGGGAFARPENRDLLARSGAVAVFLDAPVDVLWQRCQAEKKERPLMLNRRQFQLLCEQRRPSYATAPLRIDTAPINVTAVAELIALQLKLNHDRQGDVS